MALKLSIGGLLPFTTIDFPGKLAAVVFLRGCNLRCSYCHNPELVNSVQSNVANDRQPILDWNTVVQFLKKRQGLLDGVVFSGGEPTISSSLLEAVFEVRGMGFDVAIHTNGCFPDKLRALLAKDLLSYVAMDIKAPFNGYSRVTSMGEGISVRDSVRMVIDADLPHEFRTTVHPALLDDEAVLELAEELAALRVKRFVLQPFNSGKTLVSGLENPVVPFLRNSTMKRLKSAFPSFSVRGDQTRLYRE
ncbi:MAG: anaerobic ribonucleoside-triphosphate reductase activating protein [Candidatus Riflebacteria bacterium]|nr:anaerobic ribonucleoside-triphosphate reductase activating protein [Candidatus Riflebacteria bacterium]